MRRFVRLAAASSVVVMILSLPLGAEALVDDFEEDFWLPFTHFNLGDRAFAGYANGIAESGTRSYHVSIDGWALRDFGSAFGYALYKTGGASISRLGISMRVDSVVDASPSPWDAYAAGISLQLLDSAFASIGTFRYFTAYRPSLSGGRCAASATDVLLHGTQPPRLWIPASRNPAVDFPAAPWGTAEFVKVSIGFLCASGLTGAAYSLYFDDFAMDTDAGDSDGDGLEDLLEESRFHVIQVRKAGMPRPILPGATTIFDVNSPRISGSGPAGALDIELVHPRPDELSVEVEAIGGGQTTSGILWDPGFHARGIAILEPRPGQAIRGDAAVRGNSSVHLEGEAVRLYLDGAPIATAPRSPQGDFAIPWSSDTAPEGPHRLFVDFYQGADSNDGDPTSSPVDIVVDRTAPELTLRRPSAGSVLGGFVLIEAQAYDANGVHVDLLIDGVRVDGRDDEPFTFAYDTLDVPNGAHTIEVVASDRAGNEARQPALVSVNNDAPRVLLPCIPACLLAAPTAGGNLPPPAPPAEPRELELFGGDILRIAEMPGLPWRAGVRIAGTDVSITLDLLRPADAPEVNGLVGSTFDPLRLGETTTWRIRIRDHSVGEPGLIEALSLSLASRSSAVDPDTDRDGVLDGTERTNGLTSVIVADIDNDGLTDGFESDVHEISFTIERTETIRSILTSPVNPDMDGDGLLDGEELASPDGIPRTDPTVPDTDGEGLSDGAERLTHGSDPTLRDTDSDTLTDFLEVTARELHLEIDGAAAPRTIVTSPIVADTDLEGLNDGEEWNGPSSYGFLTDPTDPDTDRDGLSDFDEVVGLNRRSTNPVQSDTDQDGLVDGLDLSPTELWTLPWRTTFDAGLVRFTQRVHALGVHGLFAGIYTLRTIDGACVFLSEHTADATRSSDDSLGNVLATMNRVLVDGGETNFTATAATSLGQESFGVATITYGGCDLLAPRQYRFEYIHDSHGYDLDFLNTAPVTIRDDREEPFYFASLDVPIRLRKPQEVVLQVAIRADADRGGAGPDGATVVPAIAYSLFTGRDFLASPPFYRNLAVGAAVDQNAYEFHLRIPKEVAIEENVVMVDGSPTATLIVMPIWLSIHPFATVRSALDASTITVGAAMERIHESADLIVARLAVDTEALAAALPTSVSGLPTGFHTFGAFSVYLHRLGEPFNPSAPDSADAIYFLGDSSEEIGSFQEAIAWNPKEAWVRESQDGFGVAINIFKLIRRGISLTTQLTAAILVPLLNTPSETFEQMSFGRSALVITKLTDIETGLPYYVVGETAVETVKIRVPHPEAPGIELTEVRTVERELRGEVVDDLDDSRLLLGARYGNLKLALRGAAIGATLVIFGAQAVVAFQQGDAIKGAFYIAAGATAIFGIVKADVSLFENLLATTRILRGKSVKLGTLAGIATGGILASYELFLAAQTHDPIARLSHYESAGGIAVDGIVAAVPLYGTAAMLGWQLGLTFVVGVEALLGIMPNPLALKIVSSPGTTLVFLFEYVFTTDIPSDVAENALVSVLIFLVDMASLNNTMNPPSPTVVLVP